MNVDTLLAAARETIGTPFQHQGRLCGRGLDCAGVVTHVAARNGAEYVDVVNYTPVPDPALLERTLASQTCLVEVLKDDMRAGDILLMRIKRRAQHLAVCAGDTIIHSLADAGKCGEHGFTQEWRERVLRVYRFRGEL